MRLVIRFPACHTSTSESRFPKRSDPYSGQMIIHRHRLPKPPEPRTGKMIKVRISRKMFLVGTALARPFGECTQYGRLVSQSWAYNAVLWSCSILMAHSPLVH